MNPFVHLLLLCMIRECFSTSKKDETAEPIEDLDDNYVSDFDRTLVEQNHLFVDKTKFIVRAKIEPLPAELVLRGRGWGKTFNLNMFRIFYDIRHDENGTIVPWKQRDIYFKGGKLRRISGGKNHGEIIALKPLEISKYPMVKHMGRHPVIYLSFRGCGTSYEVFFNCTVDKIAGIIENKNYAAFLTPYCDDNLRKYKNNLWKVGANETQCQQMLRNPREALKNEELLTKSVFVLFNLLTNHFEEKPVILMDDYDYPILDMMDNEEEWEKMDNFRFKFMQNSFPNKGKYIFKGLNTGSLRFFDTKLPSLKFDSIMAGTTFADIYSEDFGFTKDEVKSLLNKRPYNVTVQDIESWFGGFTFCKSKMFNPHSVINCLLNNGAYRAFCLKNCSSVREFDYGSKMLDNIFLADYLQTDLQKLYFGHTETLQLHIADIRIVNLVILGYLTAVLIEREHKFNRYMDPNFEYNVTVPNRETRDFFRANFAAWAAHKLNLSEVGQLCRDDAVKKSYREGNVSGLKRMLKNYVLPKINVFDNHCDAIFAMLLALDGPWAVNRTFDSEFLDCVIILSPPNNNNNTGSFFISVKCTDKVPDELEKTDWMKMFRIKPVSRLTNIYSQIGNASYEYLADPATDNVKTLLTYTSDPCKPPGLARYQRKQTQWRSFVRIHQIDEQKIKRQMTLREDQASRSTTKRKSKLAKVLGKIWNSHSKTPTVRSIQSSDDDRDNSIFYI